MRTQHAGNQKIACRCCLKATALGASGAHDAYRIRAHTFLFPDIDNETLIYFNILKY